jgi:hypothetical protein
VNSTCRQPRGLHVLDTNDEHPPHQLTYSVHSRVILVYPYATWHLFRSFCRTYLGGRKSRTTDGCGKRILPPPPGTIRPELQSPPSVHLHRPHLDEFSSCPHQQMPVAALQSEAEPMLHAPGGYWVDNDIGGPARPTAVLVQWPLHLILTFPSRPITAFAYQLRLL